MGGKRGKPGVDYDFGRTNMFLLHTLKNEIALKNKVINDIQISFSTIFVNIYILISSSYSIIHPK